MREQPNYKADLVQRSNIATAVTVRTGRKITNHEVKSVARHLGIDAVTKGNHEKYYTKLQAIGITEALMHKVKLEMEAALERKGWTVTATKEELIIKIITL